MNGMRTARCPALHSGTGPRTGAWPPWLRVLPGWNGAQGLAGRVRARLGGRVVVVPNVPVRLYRETAASA
eukprot:scaffold2134_cov384-Prasinococcus_capsulatus_cf.AAC.6